MQYKTVTRYLTIGMLPIAMSACTSFDNMSAEFEEVWENPQVAVTPETQALQPVALTEEEVFALIQEVEALDPALDCERIQVVVGRLGTAETENITAISKAATCDYAARDFASARMRYQEWIALDETADAYAGLGLSYLQGGDLARAETALTRATELQPEVSWKVHNGLGYIHDQAEAWDAAQAAYETAGELAPETGVPANNLGMSYMRQERYGDAISAFSEALSRSPDLHVARLNMRTAFAMTGDLAMAYSGATDSERAAVLNSTGVAALAKGDNEEARSLFTQALQHSAVFYPNAYNNLQRAHLLTEREASLTDEAG